MMRLFLVLLGFLLLATPALAQDARETLIRDSKAALEEVRVDIERDRIDDASEVEAQLRALRDGSRERLEPLAREIARLETDRQALGPAPSENDPPESPSIQERRSSLNARLALLRGQEIQINANIFEATELLTALSSARVQTIYSQALERGPSLFAPALWTQGATSGGAILQKVAAYFETWTAERRQGAGLAAPIAIIAASLALLVLLFGPVHRWITRSFASRIERFEPTRTRRVVVAGINMLAHAGPGLVGGFIVFEALRSQGIITAQGADVARTAWFALVAFLLVNGFAAGLFAPRNPKWRIAPVVEEYGRRASALVVAIVAIFGAKTVIAEIASAAGADAAVDQLIDGTSAVAIGILLFLLCRSRFWRAETAESPPADATSRTTDDDAKKSSAGFWRVVRGLGRLIAVLTIIAPFAGYIQFADFITSRFYFLALILAIAWFARSLTREAARWTTNRLGDTREGQSAEKSEGLDLFWINAAIDTMFALAIIPAVLVLAGYRWSFVHDVVAQAFFGFQIGGVQVPSLAKILIAIAVFVGVLALTRLVQRGLTRGPFAHSRLDPGVQNSLTTLIGYGGLILALLFGITSLGFNLANLAIIAGALSVGIGFGLQSIVNNFVSGLILLFERPIKVGDWVVTASGEGTVKKISVRSTEIETFDRATIIVPNSELVSQTVTNWTHKDKIGRVAVPVGVAYGADPEKVRDILLKCARDHPLVVRYPEPFVVWKDFGASSLDFEVRCYLRDIVNGLTVRTDLRFAIFKAFAEAGIEIPFPQRDLHIKSMPDFGAKKALAEKTSKAREPAPAAPPSEPEIAEDD